MAQVICIAAYLKSKGIVAEIAPRDGGDRALADRWGYRWGYLHTLVHSTKTTIIEDDDPMTIR